MRLATIRKLIDHMAWANAAVERALAEAESPDPEALALFAHVLGAAPKTLVFDGPRKRDVYIGDLS